MSSLIKVSEAASLALHTAVFLAGNPERPVSARKLPTTLSVSEAHLAKCSSDWLRSALYSLIAVPEVVLSWGRMATTLRCWTCTSP